MIPVLLALLLGCSSDSDLGEEWTAITEEDFPLVFAPAKLQGTIARYLRSTRYRNGRATLTHQASWRGAGARLPRAGLRLEQYGRGFVVAQSAETMMNRLVGSIFKDRRPQILAEDQDVNVLGTIDYLQVRNDEAECVVFSQNWRRQGILNILVGHYCAAATPGLSDTRITTVLRSLKFR